MFEHLVERMEDKDSKLDLYNTLPSRDEAFGRANYLPDGRPVKIYILIQSFILKFFKRIPIEKSSLVLIWQVLLLDP